MIKQQFLVWKLVSYTWVEWEIEQSEIEDFVRQLKNQNMNWSQVEYFIYRESLWGFSGYALIFLFSLIPILGALILPTFMPDLEMEDRHVIARIQHFKKWNKFYLCNPICWLGYVFAYLMSKRMIKKLKHAFD